MRLLFDATVLEYPATGVAKVTLGLYAACRKQVPSLDIVGLHRRPFSAPLPSGIRASQWGSFLPPALWRRIHLPAATLRQKNPIIHFPWNGKVPLLPPSATVLTTLHDVLPLIIPGHFADAAAERKYRNERQADISRTDLLLTDSDYSKREIQNNFTVRQEPVVIPFGPTLTASEPAFPAGQEKYFLYVGGYDPRKGLPQLLKAFLDLYKEGKLHSKLVLTGSKLHVSETFQQLVREGVKLGALDEQGYVSDATLASLYAGALALVYPSKYEGFGLPPLEAMTLGCPVITTRCTSLPEVCGDAAYYIDPDSPSSIGQSLLEVETNSTLRARLRELGKQQAAGFSWERAAEIFLSALERTMQTRASHIVSRRS
jgi:glycosyltransferase involved in cell wall biosynthesis